jgi:hypothetical protein
MDEQTAWQNIAVHTQLRLDFANEQVDSLRSQIQTLNEINQSVASHARTLQASVEALGEALFAFLQLSLTNLDAAASESHQEAPTSSSGPFLDGSGSGQ